MIIGEQQPESLAGRLAGSILVVAFVTPWLLIGGGLALVGLLAIGPRKGDISELWLGLPAGGALFSLFVWVLYMHFWRLPRLTISRFEFDGATLAFVTRMYGAVTRPVGELRSVVEDFRRRSGLKGWWLKFQNSGWVYLSRNTSNGEELIRQIGPQANDRFA